MKYSVGLDDIDWNDNDSINAAYLQIFKERGIRLQRLMEADEKQIRDIKHYYRDHIPDFIEDWGVTFDPRNVARGIPAIVPFLLFDVQRQFVDWIVQRWKNREPGVADKSRDMGFSWLCVGTTSSLCIFYDNLAIGYGSRKEEYVDSTKGMKALFPKARTFVQHLPPMFRGGCDVNRDSSNLRISFPSTGSYMSGEAGDNIGRGDRTGLYIVDESAFLERPELAENSLSQTTDCRIDVSSANGTANPFYEKVSNYPASRRFTMHWKDDPRKDDSWYEEQKRRWNPVVVAQEIDIDYTASVEGILIPSLWVNAAVDAHIKLGIHPSGDRFGALDVADEGKDGNAFVGIHGCVVEVCEEWSGKGIDIYQTTAQSFSICDLNGYKKFRYDSDGLGAGVRGDSRVLNENRPHGQKINVIAYRGSGPVQEPDKTVKGTDRKNKDFFANAKAQAWWDVRELFENTYNAVVNGHPYDPDSIISLPSKLKNLAKLKRELSQPTGKPNGVGKYVVDKAPDGMPSPNCADALVIAKARVKEPLVISAALLERSAMSNLRYRPDGKRSFSSYADLFR